MKTACLAGLLIGGLALGCSDSDTIVALNVCTLGSVDAESVDELHVTIPLPGGGTATRELQNVAVLSCGTNPSYYKRIKLPPDTEKGRSTIEVEARDASGAFIEEGSTTITVRPEEAVAAFVELGEEPMMGSGGMGGMAGGGGQAGAGAGGVAGASASAGAGGSNED